MEWRYWEKITALENIRIKIVELNRVENRKSNHRGECKNRIN